LTVQQIKIDHVWILPHRNYHESISDVRGSHTVAFFGNAVSFVCHEDWKNPYLIVRRDGIEIAGITPVGLAIAVESVPRVLERLPDSAWPYGLIVVVHDIGILSGKTDLACIEVNRTKLLNLLKELGVAVDRWPSA
jgi:hypothetical protein